MSDWDDCKILQFRIAQEMMSADKVCFSSYDVVDCVKSVDKLNEYYEDYKEKCLK